MSHNLFQLLISRGLLICLLVIFSSSGQALDIAGIVIPDEVRMGDDTRLTLNGAGVREKLFTDIYVAALYLDQSTADVDAILNSPGPKRIALHFIYREVSAEKLIEGLDDGFRLNLSLDDHERLRTRLQHSYGFFETMRGGDTVYLDYHPESGTHVIINNRLKGRIPGPDFYRALLMVWLGHYPAQEKLRLALLGSSQVANTDR